MNFAIWILFIALLIAYASAGIVPQEEYLPPVEEEEQVAAEQPLEESAALAKDGYRYKTIRKLRHRRDVSELLAQGTLTNNGYHYHAPQESMPLPKISKEYLPPVEDVAETKESPQLVSNQYLPPPLPTENLPEQKSTSLAPEISREYLPPTEAAATLDVPKFAANEELPLEDDDAVIIEGPEESSILADDGYHYRTIRYKRDVSEIVPSSSAGYTYEAPASDVQAVESSYIPPESYLPPPAAEIKEAPATAELADDGYRYKTVRKLKYRQRRDVDSCAPSEEYLPPVANVNEAPETAELADDGYRYKTIRKLKYRQRRDVSEILSKASDSATLSDDGYHYRIPEPTQVISKISKEYLPPSEKIEELTEAPKEVKTTKAPVVTESTTVLTESTTAVTEAVPEVTESTTKVTEAPSTITSAPVISNEYLPPVEEVPLLKEAIEVSSTTVAPVISNQYLPPTEQVAIVKEAPSAVEESAILADDGYHYKVGRRFKIKRDVSEVIAPDNGYTYKAPAASNAAITYLPPAEIREAPAVSSLYLPPAEEVKNDAEIVEAPEESAALTEDGYRYKTVRRLKYRLRHRRDVSELVAPVQDSAILAEDGYHYKAPSNEYLPPVEDVAEAKEALIVEPTISSEVPEVSNQYLPPQPSLATLKEAAPLPVVSNEYLPPAESVKESAALADDGYRYKTVRRIRYRHRREVAQQADGYNYKAPSPAPVEIEAQEIQYVPPVVEAEAQVKETLASASLADDGYRYKTVRRIRYRHRV